MIESCPCRRIELRIIPETDGVGALVRLAAYVGNELEMEILFIGRAPFDRNESCTLEAAGSLQRHGDGSW